MHHEPTAANGLPPAVAEPPAAGRRSIFRAQALDEYLREQEKAVLPRVISPRVFGLLWAVAAVLLALGFGIVFWPAIAALLAGGP